MTRGQDSLAIEEVYSASQNTPSEKKQFYELPSVVASTEELQAHEAYLAALDKTSGDQTLWRQLTARSGA